MSVNLKNTQFSRVGILQGDGTMLVLEPREEVDASNVNLEEPHLTSMLSKGYVAIREGGKTAAEGKKSRTEPVKTSS